MRISHINTDYLIESIRSEGPWLKRNEISETSRDEKSVSSASREPRSWRGCAHVVDYVSRMNDAAHDRPSLAAEPDLW